MILFYDKKDGAIAGTIEGRIHTEEHLNMWIGDKDKTERLVIQWKPVRFFDKDGNRINQGDLDEKGNPLVFTADFEPDHPDKKIFEDFERKRNDPQYKNILDYKINPQTKRLNKLNAKGQ